MAVLLEERLLTRADYHKMAEVGIIRPNEAVELLNGKIIRMSPIGSEHAANVEDIYFLIEVADSSLEKDRISKLSIYAKAKIPYYWITNLQNKEIEIYSNPSGNKYLSKQVLVKKEKVELSGFSIHIPVSDLLI